MSIAEQIIRAKTDIDEVYEAGQSSMIDESKIIEKTAAGRYISVDDVSEIPHSVACKISGVDNPETVQVTRCGRNLLNPNALGSGEIVEYNGVPCYKGIEGGNPTVAPTGMFIEGCFKPNTRYTLTVRGYKENKNPIVAAIAYTDGSAQNSGQEVSGTLFTVTSAAGRTIRRIYFANYARETVYLDLSVSCLYEGTTALSYEPYNGQTLTPKVDGTVGEMTSVSPYMNIFTDNAEATLEATYRMSWGMQEERERFFNDFQQGKINVSISFEWLALDKANTTSVINALSATTTGQTLTLNLPAVNAAFETSSGAKDGSTSTEFAALVATKTNWTIVLK